MWNFFKPKHAFWLAGWAFAGLWAGVGAPFVVLLWPATWPAEVGESLFYGWLFYVFGGWSVGLFATAIGVAAVRIWIHDEVEAELRRLQESVENEQIRRDIENQFRKSWKIRFDAHIADISELETGMQHIQSSAMSLGSAAGDSHKILDQVYSINQALEEVVNKSVDASISVQSAIGATQEVSRTLANNIDFITGIQDFFVTCRGAFAELHRQMEAVEKVTQGIVSINTKTTIVALNAAIEAARLGEQGRTFAVVADEVQSLAQGTKRFASQIQTVSRQMGVAVHQLLNQIQLADNQIQEHAATLPAINQLLSEVTSASQESEVAISEQRGTLQRLNRTTQDALEGLDRLADLTTQNAKVVHLVENEVLQVSDQFYQAVNILRQQIKMLQLFHGQSD